MSEIKRVLAEVVRIETIDPIPNADAIEVVTIRGWKVVVQKGLYKVNDLAVYFSIDALLPEEPEFEFLRDRCYVSKTQEGAGFRIKTITLRKQISQGMLMPMAEMMRLLGGVIPREGTDVTEILNVKKYEKILPAELGGNARGNFPSFIPKTDEHRIQNFIGKFKNEYRDHEWEVSLKCDGSSMTVYYNGTLPADPAKTIGEKIARFFSELFNGKKVGRFGVCSRNLDLKESADNTFWKVAREYDLEGKLRDYFDRTGKSIAIQGELMGPGIQKNREELVRHDLYIFNIWDIDEQRYWTSSERVQFASEYGLTLVPVYGVFKFENHECEDFLKDADTGFGGKSIKHPIREGLVYKSVIDPSVSFKAISNRYLMKCEE